MPRGYLSQLWRSFSLSDDASAPGSAVCWDFCRSSSRAPPSGIYRLSTAQIERLSIDVPLLGHSELAYLPVLILFITFFITIPLSATQLLSPRDGLSREQKVFWLVITFEGLEGEAGLIEGCPQVTFNPRYGFPRRIDNTRCANADRGIEAGVVEVLAFTAIDPARSPAVSKGPVPADIATRWLRGQPCRLPCYEGLTPGITTAQEAFHDLRRHPLVGSVALTRFPADQYGEVAWTWADGSAGGSAVFGLEDPEIIQSIWPSGDPHITLSEIIAAYGEPTEVVTTDFCASWGKDRFYHLEFLNRSVGLYMRGPYKDVQRVPTGLPIQSITIYKPGSDSSHFDYSYTDKERIKVSPWQSYQDFYFYSGTNPDMVCP